MTNHVIVYVSQNVPQNFVTLLYIPPGQFRRHHTVLLHVLCLEPLSTLTLFTSLSASSLLLTLTLLYHDWMCRRLLVGTVTNGTNLRLMKQYRSCYELW